MPKSHEVGGQNYATHTHTVVAPPQDSSSHFLFCLRAAYFIRFILGIQFFFLMNAFCGKLFCASVKLLRLPLQPQMEISFDIKVGAERFFHTVSC